MAKHSIRHQTVVMLALAATLLSHPSPALALNGAPIDRKNLKKTFGDEFTRFSWFAEGAVPKVGGGTWRTNFGYTWVPVGDVKNHTLIWNGEEQIYVDPGFTGTSSQPLGLNAFSIKNGVLKITANRTVNQFLSGYRYTSGLITSEATFSQKYGVFEMRAKLPKGKGLWPAFWMLPSDKSWPPEIDIMEALGHQPNTLYATLHTNETGSHTTSGPPPQSVPDWSTAFHTYAVDWGPNEVIFYFDGKEFGRKPTPADMHKPFYMLLNLAVGGSWPGSPTVDTKFPAEYQIDWVRAYQRSSYVNATPATAVKK